MDGLRCTSAQCGEPLSDGDVFCGNCGTPAPRAQPAMAWTGPAAPPGAAGTYTAASPHGVPRGGPTRGGETSAGASPAAAGAAHFGHEPRRQSGPLNNTTRYLCAAAYIDNGFANRVIRALLTTRRAVAPSLNLDLGPIIWHCQRARRIILFRDLTLVASMILGLFVSPPATAVFLLWTFLLGWVPARVKWKERSVTVKVLLVLIGLYLLPVIAFATFSLLVATIIGTSVTSFTSVFGSGGSAASAGQATGESGLRVAVAFLALAGLTWGTELVVTYVTRRTLIEQLALGAPSPRPAQEPVSDRIAMVEGAQWGNVTLYATEDPFIGAGVEVDIERRWSIAIRLDPADAARQVLSLRPAPGEWVPIDPVELHRAIREKLRSLNDPGLSVNQRITSLSVADRLVGSGVLRWDSPLVDRNRLTPYSSASPETIEAIIRHPQAGLRYYQHVAISDEGPPVMLGGQQVLDGADQGIAISAFVYAAVEGRHFYLQFIMTALPPIHPDYRNIDLLPDLSSGRMVRWMLRRSLKRFLIDTADSPAGLVAALRLWLAEQWAEDKAVHARGSVAGDLGATVSVRQLGTSASFGSYIRELDVEKYNRIIERAVLETVQDFLASKGVDISAFSSSALNIINGDVIGVTGSGNVVAARNSRVSTRSGPR